MPAARESEMSLRTAVLSAIVAISAITSAQSASAQSYPTKPIHLIVPYSAGGGTDFFARLVGQKMTDLISQTIGPWQEWKTYDFTYAVSPDFEPVYYGFVGRFGNAGRGAAMVIDANRTGHFFSQVGDWRSLFPY
jgi:hypothetical protein